MAALKRLAERYKDKVQIITFVQQDAVWTNADNKAFEGAKWQRLALPKTATLWQQLGWNCQSKSARSVSSRAGRTCTQSFHAIKGVGSKQCTEVLLLVLSL